MKDKEKLYYSIGIGIIIVVIIFLCVVFFNKKYTITMYNDGEEYKIIKIEKGEKLKLPDAPEKEGYTFSGWYVDGKEFDKDTKITKDLELEAKWVKNTYTVIFKTGTGSDITKKVKYKDTVAKPSNPTKEGYEFVGWFIGDKKYNFASKVTKDLEITAKWTKVSTTSKTNSTSNVKRTERNAEQSVAYQVEHYLMDTKGKYSDKPNYIDSYTTVVGAKVKPIVHSYKGFTSPIVQTVTAGNNTVVKYYYERNKYQLTLNNSEGITTVKGNGTYYYDEEVVIEATLHEGYSFAGWLENEKVKDNKAVVTIKIAASDMSLIATAKINKYKVTFDVNGGQENIASQEITYNELIEKVNDPTKKGYDFVRWTLDGETFDVSTPMPAKDITLRAEWKLADTTVRYLDENGKEIDMDVEAKPNEKVEKTHEAQNFETKLGYKFLGWYTKDNQKFDFDNEKMLANGGLELTAKFEIIEYSINYNDETTKGSNKDKYTVEDEFELTSPAKTGYAFVGWYTDEDLSEDKKLEDNKIKKGTTGDITLYAKFAANKYTVHFDSNGGSGEMKDQTLTYDQKEKLITNSYKKTGYTFIYWTFNGEEYKDSAEVQNLATDGKITLIAEWEANKYTVKFNANGGLGEMEDQTLTYDEEKALTKNNDNITREGYTFLGWSETEDAKDATYTDGKNVKNLTDQANGNITLYAVWKSNEIEITYHANNKNNEIDIETYEFDGEKDSKAKKFTNSFIVTYKDHDKNSIISKDNVNADFVCWSENETGNCINEESYTNELKEAIKTNSRIKRDLYAKWDADIELKNPEEDENREFVGWYLDDQKIENETDGKYTIDTDVTIEAKYLKIIDLDKIIMENFKDNDNYNLTLQNHEIIIDILKPDALIKDLATFDKLQKLLKEDIIKSVTVDSTTVNLNDKLNEVGSHKFSYLLGTSIKLNIQLNEDLAKLKDSEQTLASYTIKFTNNSKNIITVKEYKEFAEKMLPLINIHKSTRYNVSVNDSNIKVLYADSISTLTLASSLQGSGILTVFQQYLANDYIKSMELTLPKKEGFDGTDMHVTVYPDDVTDDNYIIFGLSLVEYFEKAGYERTIKNYELDNITIKVKINPQDDKYFQEGIFDDFNITFGPQNQA